MKKGFTILELMIAVVVISIGVLGAYSVVQQIFSITFISSTRLTSAYLAQEGIEKTRNTRDANWLQGNDWDDGIVNKSESNILPKYNRETTISSNPDGSLKVSVKVTFSGRGDNQEIIVEENLYDWK